jgi:glycosyltransferase involved in cell wall biosynthesis
VCVCRTFSNGRPVKVAIVIPAFNEAESIAAVVMAVSAYGTPIVVDDGSSDDTGARAAEAGAVVVRQPQNRGYDAALAAGFAKADAIGADIVVTADADGQLDTAVIPDALAKLNDADLVLGVRQAPPARWSEMVFNCYTHARFGVPDILCGLKAFRLDQYRAFRDRMVEPSVYTALALSLLRRGKKPALVPVGVRPRDGVSRFGVSWRGEWRILRAFFLALRDEVVHR